MRIAVYQFGSSSCVEANFSAIKKAIAQAYEREVRLLVFHECAACGYPPVETADVHLIDFDLVDKHIRDVQDLARAYKIYIALGTIEKLDGQYYNALIFINDAGERVGCYHKRALWGWDLDSFSRGQLPGILQIDDIRVGFRICFEVRFPEYFRELFAQEVDLCFVSFSDVSESDLPRRYELIKAHLMTRAAENVMTVASVNSVSSFQTAPTAVFDINGQVVAEAPKNAVHLLVYDYIKPKLGYGEAGRRVNSYEAIKIRL